MLVTLLVLILRVPGSSVGNVIHREALEVVMVREGRVVGIGVGEGLRGRRMANRNMKMDRLPTTMPATEKSTARKAKRLRQTLW